MARVTGAGSPGTISAAPDRPTEPDAPAGPPAAPVPADAPATPPAGTDATSISFTLFRSPSRGYQKAIWAPSGEKTGNDSSSLRPVSGLIVPPATSRICTVL